ncbi:hypothetical protein F511_43305 [Dorcoceras hygrometricum]|uniref:Late embryogenesis abundant protein LEA-2 subgroup domain-containing protein n=1 Tax=Dorcoceras hygrometricum TaxID=472368 RepID=A0A2Z7AW14_9LAMI|nr:hypothetical protein F511_43305 [Dorcoceras hygrometricum]
MGPKRIPKTFKICCCTTTVLIIILFLITLTLFLTILKPKQPKITTRQVTLLHFDSLFDPFEVNVTLGITVNVDNPNYGSFRFGNTAAYVSYRGTPAAEAPIEGDTIPARGQHDITTEVVVTVDKLLSNSNFWDDYNAGCLNFTSTAVFHGRAEVLRVLKIKATSYSSCDISIYVEAQNASSVCRSRIKY